MSRQSINFTEIFRDSWNFSRNNAQLILTFFVIYSLINIGLSYLFPQTAFNPNMSMEEMSAYLNENQSTMILSYIVGQVCGSLITAWLSSCVHQISLGRSYSLVEAFQYSLSKLIGIIILGIIMLLPMLIALVSAIFLLMNRSSVLIFTTLFFTFVGIIILIRVNLSSLHYLLNNISISQALTEIWQKGNHRKGDLVIYALILTLFPMMVSSILKITSSQLIIAIFSMLIGLFLIIFSYRFYTVFMQRV